MNKELLTELHNFIEDLTLGSSDLTENYIMFKAKRFVDMLKEMKNNESIW